MVERLAFDTTFLIDLQRERKKGEHGGPAHSFLTRNRDAEMHIPTTVLGEFAEGFAAADHPLVQLVEATHVLLPIDRDVALRYAAITRELRRVRQLIGTNDLWIGACCLRHELPLVTANEQHFSRIPGLRVLAYR